MSLKIIIIIYMCISTGTSFGEMSKYVQEVNIPIKVHYTFNINN